MLGGAQAPAASSSSTSDLNSFLSLFNLLTPDSGQEATPEPKLSAGALLRSMLGMQTKDRANQDDPKNAAPATDPALPVPAPPAASAPAPAASNSPAASAPAALPQISKTAPQAPLAFGARLTKTGADPTAPALAAQSASPSDAPQIVLPAAKSEPARRDRDETPAQQQPAADAPDFPVLAATAYAAPPDHAAPASAPVRALPAPAVADAIRASEPTSSSAPAAASGGPAHEIVVRVARPESSPVDLQVTQRAGEVRVAVRTADPAMQVSLRQELPTLVNSLERAGYHAETFTPADTMVRAAAASSETSFTHHQRDSQPDTPARHESDLMEGRQQERRQREQQRLNWFEQMEK